MTFVGRALVPGLLVLLATSVAGADVANHLPSILARYEVSRGPGKAERFELLRADMLIEHRFIDRKMTEVWRRAENGQLTHLKVFHHERRVVHYTSGDLRALRVHPSWEQLSTLYHPDQRSRMTRAGRRTRVHNQPTTELRGTLGKDKARLLWIDALSAVAELSVGKSAAPKLRLTQIETCTTSTCVAADLTDYQEIEFADLGDAEHDPFVRTFLASQGHGHGRGSRPIVHPHAPKPHGD